MAFDDALKTRTRNAPHLLSLISCDWGLTPTRWQWQQHPDVFRSQISVIHEGVDTDRVCPTQHVAFALSNGRSLTKEDEVITYVARNLEPYRGFHVFMRSVPLIQRRHPNAQIVVVGADGVSYGKSLPAGQTYRRRMLGEVCDCPGFDPARIHFLGQIPYEQYLSLLQVSTAHVYLTYPFVLSWSMLEAMAVGCTVVASATAPVLEVIEDGVNGLLFDFFSPSAIADTVDQVLEDSPLAARLGAAARRTIVEHYDLNRVCLPAQKRLIAGLVGGCQASCRLHGC